VTYVEEFMGITDGRIEVQPAGGTPPYTFQWADSGTTGPIRSDLAAGQYTLTITDINGCALPQTIAIAAPPELELDYTVNAENCAQPGTGSITGVAARGGVPPYTVALTVGGRPLAGTTDFSALAAGTYELAIVDGNGCRRAESVTVRAPRRPVLSASAVEPLIRLGENTVLRLRGADLDSVRWQPATGLDCTDCPDPVAAPTETTRYVVTARSADGCTARDTVLLQVVPVRDVYVPNAFSPNQDGVNDRFRPFAGPAVTRVLTFAVYDRWGAEVYTAGEFRPGDPSVGWDGMRGTRPATAGVYAWRARVEFIDGFVRELKGSVVLLPGR
jgi:gliding motility-associated-like protein